MSFGKASRRERRKFNFLQWHKGHEERIAWMPKIKHISLERSLHICRQFIHMFAPHSGPMGCDDFKAENNLHHITALKSRFRAFSLMKFYARALAKLLVRKLSLIT